MIKKNQTQPEDSDGLVTVQMKIQLLDLATAVEVLNTFTFHD